MTASSARAGHATIGRWCKWRCPWGKGLLALLLLALGSVPVEARQAVASLRVVIIDSSDPSEPVAQRFGRAVREALATGRARQLEVYSEFLDALRLGGAPYEAEFVALLRKKYDSRPPDLLVTVFPQALQFVESHRHELWTNVPTVFVGIPDDVPRWQAPTATVTGVRSHVDVSGTLALAVRLQPQARHVAVVSGLAEFDRLWRDRVASALRAYEGRLEATYVDGLDANDLAAALGRLPPDSFVLFTTMFRTVSGPTAPLESAQRVARAASVPVYTLFEPTLGAGVVGGSLIDLGREAARAGQLALAIAEGRRPLDLGIDPSPPSTARVDWRAMQRFGLSERLLPPGAVVLFRPTSVWSEYRGTIITVLVVLGLQFALIATLLVERRHRRRAELRAQQRSVELAHASRLATVGEITASIAHQINQPLGAILSNADAAEMLLETRPLPLEELREILRDIRQDDVRAHEVIRGMRDLLRRREVELTAVPFNAAIAQVVQLVQGEARRLGVTLHTELAAGLPDVLGDRVHLQQVALNLVMNGLEAAAGRGDRPRVTVRTGLDDTGEVEMIVSDTGPGISPELLPRLFDSFVTTKQDGMGLGLSIARSLVELHGGRIWVAEGGGQGATFHVVIPAAGHSVTTPAVGQGPSAPAAASVGIVW